MKDIYDSILIAESNTIKQTIKRIQISQNDLDNYIKFYKSHMNLNIEDANKLIIRYHEDIKQHASKLYDLIKKVKNGPLDKTNEILIKLSSYLNDIEKDMRTWEQKS